MKAPDCPVGATAYGDRECNGPGTYYCDDMIWGSRCRSWQKRNGGFLAPDGQREVEDPTPAEKLAQAIHVIAIEVGEATKEWRKLSVREARMKIEIAELMLASGIGVLP